jgi:hypothetical protein
VRAVIESMTGARFVHDTLEPLGWEVLIADAQKVNELAPLACNTDKIDARVLAVLSVRDLVPAIWLPDPRIRSEREQARFRLHLVKHRVRIPPLLCRKVPFRRGLSLRRGSPLAAPPQRLRPNRRRPRKHLRRGQAGS